jgi:type I restriction enzyme S subunit
MHNLPDDWELLTLDQLVAADKPIVYGIVQAGPEVPNGVPYIKSSDVGGAIEPKTLSRTSPDIANRYARSVVRPGDIIFSLRGNIGELSIVPDTLSEANLTQGTARISVNGKAINQYVASALKSPFLQRRIAMVGKGSTFKEISLEELRRLEVPLPPIAEQRKIAEILLTWDKAIEKLEALRIANLQRRIWLRSHVFTGRIRLPGHSEEWREVALGEVLTEHKLRGTGTEEVFSVSVHKGLINQIEHLGRSFAAADTDHYNRVKPGDLVYTKSPTGSFPLGIIKQSKIPKEVIVSPLYGVFTPKTYEVGVILDALFESPIAVRNYLNPLVQKGAKNTIAITNRDFLKGRLRLPLNSAEQVSIANVVMASQAELAGIVGEIDALTRQKRGLMQKLLTGKWRVAQEAAVA